MRLHELMQDRVDDVLADAPGLARQARDAGGRLRRRRRARVLAGTSVAVIVLGVGAIGGGASLLSGTDSPQDLIASDPTPAGSATPTPPAAVEPLTGLSTAALLRDLVLAERDGQTTEYAGQGGTSTSDDTYAQLTLTPAGEGLGVIGVNVQDLEILRGQPRDCSLSFLTECRVETLAGGDILRTYEDEPTPTAGGVGRRLVAEVLSPDRGLRIVVSATNGRDLPSNRWDLTRVDPVLDRAQLAAVATSPRWGLTVDAAYGDAGRSLAGYTDLDAEVAR